MTPTAQDTLKAIELAVQREREACASLCEELAQKRWDAYKHGRKADGLGDPFAQGQSDGAEQCAAFIRARGTP